MTGSELLVAGLAWICSAKVEGNHSPADCHSLDQQKDARTLRTLLLR